jgi:hypothetical protein
MYFSVLIHSSIAVRHLRDQSRLLDIPLLYYFFSFREERTQTCENLVRSLLSQLLCHLSHIPASISDLYDLHLKGAHRPSVQDLARTLVAVVGELKEVWIVVDALDECREWNKLWRLLATIVQNELASLRLLLTSRPERQIEDAMNSLHITSISLNGDPLDDDIQNFVLETLRDDPRYSHISLGGKELIFDTLVDGAGGMFVIILPIFTR